MERKVRLFICTILILILGIFLFACAGSNEEEQNNGGEEQETYEFSAVWVAAEDTPMVRTAKRLAENLETKSDGLIKTTIYHSQQISTSDRENAEKVQQGIVQMTTIPTFSVAEVSGIKEFSLFDLPYLFSSEEEINNLLDSDIMKPYYDQLLQKTGFRSYSGYFAGWTKVGTTRKEVNEPKDLAGLRIRTTASESNMELMKAWGAAPTPMAFGEVFTGLQQGTIDGLLGQTTMIHDEKFYEALKYLIEVNPNANTHVVLVNDSWYQKLPDDLKTIFDECMAEYLVDIRKALIEAEIEAMESVAKSGVCEMIYLSDAERAEWSALTEAAQNQLAEKIVGIDFVNSVKNFLGD